MSRTCPTPERFRASQLQPERGSAVEPGAARRVGFGCETALALSRRTMTPCALRRSTALRGAPILVARGGVLHCLPLLREATQAGALV